MALNPLHALAALLHAHSQNQEQVNQPVSSTPVQNGGLKFLGYKPAAPDQSAPLVFQKPITQTPIVNSNMRPALQRYGDPQGHQWLENDDGQKFNVPQVPENFDAPLSSSFHDVLRPGITGRYPVTDSVFRPDTKTRKKLLRVSI